MGTGAVVAGFVVVLLVVVGALVYMNERNRGMRQRPTTTGALFGEGVGDLVQGAFGIAGMA